MECRNCKFAIPVPVKAEDLSLEAQAKMKAIVGKPKAERLKEVEKVVTSEAYAELIKAHGGFSMTKKSTDVNGTYIICSNEDNLKDEKATKGGVVYKYYHSCPHFEPKPIEE